LALIFFFLSSKSQLKKLKNTLTLFLSFFEEAGHKSVIIDENKVMFSDFAPIATLANKMIEERNKAESKLKASLEENTILLKEVHHRVKNNLQVIMSLIRLQMSNIEDEKIRNYFIDMKNRVFSMALIHEKFYGSNAFSTVNIKNFISEFIKNIIQSYSIETNVSLNVDIKDLFLKIDVAIPIGLIINEIISNSMKYAFKGIENGLIELKIYEDEDKSELNLFISDDGVGIPKNIDIKTAETLGLNLIYSFVSQLDGNIKLDTDNGTAYHITIPLKK
jgi:two-component sensor histidine kinase